MSVGYLFEEPVSTYYMKFRPTFLGRTHDLILSSNLAQYMALSSLVCTLINFPGRITPTMAALPHYH